MIEASAWPLRRRRRESPALALALAFRRWFAARRRAAPLL